jgi:hypothetical protein
MLFLIWKPQKNSTSLPDAQMHFFAPVFALVHSTYPFLITFLTLFPPPFFAQRARGLPSDLLWRNGFNVVLLLLFTP